MHISRYRKIATCGLALLVAACEATTQQVWQDSPTVGLLNGLYDGITPVSEARKHGDIGLGTWDRLNGEGLIIDNVFYQVRSDGTVHVMEPNDTMAWVSTTFFNPETVLKLPRGLTMATLPRVVDPQLPTVNTFYAVRIDGVFDMVQTRSLPRQSKPYPPFCKVEETEPKFLFRDVKGTMVGFLSPPFVTNMAVPNWHLHFLNEEKSGGGHVLRFILREGEMKVDRVDGFKTRFPVNPAYEKANLSSIIQCK